MSGRARTKAIAGGAVAVALVAGVVAGWALVGRDEALEGTVFVAEADHPAAMAPLVTGGLVFGEKDTGRIRVADAEGTVQIDDVARLQVSAEGHRGLLGLAVDIGERVYAAWTRPDHRLVVGRIGPGGHELVWRGPRVPEEAIGGHLAFTPNCELLIGVGDMGEPDLVSDPDAPNGKILGLSPLGPPDQEPEIHSTGWHNPFAFTFDGLGRLVVADNAPGDSGERLAVARRDGPARVVTLTRETAPSGIALTESGDLAVCGYVSKELRLHEVNDDGSLSPEGELLATDCSLGVVTLSDGRLAYATQDAIKTLQVER